VKAAFWLYRSEADQWYLHLVSDAVHQLGITEAYKAVIAVMRRMPDLGIDPLEVKLIPPDNPIAKAVTDYLSGPHGRLPRRIRGTRLGDVYFEDAFFYDV
jgi:hypothetical protein